MHGHMWVWLAFTIFQASSLEFIIISDNSLALCMWQRSTGRLRGRKGLLSGGGKDRDGGGPVMFADVAGVDEAKEELEEIVVHK